MPVPIYRKVVLARTVAARHLGEVMRPEYRLTVFLNGPDNLKFVGLLKGMRDGKLRIAGMGAPPHFGVRAEFDSVVLWSSESDTLNKLATWFELRGFETSGVH